MRHVSNGLVRLILDQLESRCTPTIINVTDYDTWNVNDKGSLPWAVQEANTLPGADIILFSVGINQAKLVQAESTLSITGEVTIRGAMAEGSSVTITGTKPFEFREPTDGLPRNHAIEGVTFKGCLGEQGGAVEIYAQNTVTVRNCAFIENKGIAPDGAGTETDGGAVYVRSGAKFVISSGAGQPVDNGTFVGQQTVFLRNESLKDGGAIGSMGEVVIEAGWFQDNKAARHGGGIAVKGGDAKVTMAGGVSTSTFENNALLGVVDPPGGPQPVGVSIATFKNNKALAGNGGGIYFGADYAGASSLAYATFFGNDAAANLVAIETGFGGGVFIDGGTLSLSNCAFESNTAGTVNPATGLVHGGGGALALKNTTVNVATTDFSHNSATATGQHSYGISVGPNGKGVATNCTYLSTSIYDPDDNWQG